MNYLEASAAFDALPMTSKLDLTRVPKLLKLLGDPQQRMKCVHLAGTNGKGSTGEMLSRVLMCAGYSAGFFNSPHLTKVNESIRINGEPISDEDFAMVFGDVFAACDKMEDYPTSFEILTAAAFLYYCRAGVDIAVIEVGMGGATDATNVIDQPVLSVIVPIGLDHMEYLGETIEEIARVKGGIIKPERPVAIARQNPKALAELKKISASMDSKVYSAQDFKYKIESQDERETVFSIELLDRAYGNLRLGLPGEYQIENAATVIAATIALNDCGFNIDEEALRQGLYNARWAGRMQLVSSDPLIIFDCAHNPHGAQAFAKSIKGMLEHKSKSNLVLVLGVLADKDYIQMLEIMLPLAGAAVFTQPNHSTRALAAQELAEAAKKLNFDGIEFYVEKDSKKALELAKSIARGAPIACVGSIYMISALLGE